MATTSPPTIAALPTPPSTASPSNFDAIADAFLGAMPTLRTEVNAATGNVYNNALDAKANADAAASSAASSASQAGNAAIAAAAAATSSGAPIWVSGTTYALGAPVWSPANRIIYRRIVAGSGTTDPSLDTTNWALLGTLGFAVVTVAGTTQAALASTHYILTNAAATTVTLPASPASGDTVWITTTGTLVTNVIARNGRTIMGSATDMTLDSAAATVRLRFVNSDWKLI